MKWHTYFGTKQFTLWSVFCFSKIGFSVEVHNICVHTEGEFLQLILNYTSNSFHKLSLTIQPPLVLFSHSHGPSSHLHKRRRTSHNQC